MISEVRVWLNELAVSRSNEAERPVKLKGLATYKTKHDGWIRERTYRIHQHQNFPFDLYTQLTELLPSAADINWDY